MLTTSILLRGKNGCLGLTMSGLFEDWACVVERWRQHFEAKEGTGRRAILPSTEKEMFKQS